jgi:hypothetical protein
MMMEYIVTAPWLKKYFLRILNTSIRGKYKIEYGLRKRNKKFFGVHYQHIYLTSLTRL